ncbi:hypothetical protein E2C01_012166 [Portunus trituberculatus]|uniref:Uncharacterized protein n=1 Tax=Portunus trituberculatus TaxID=210409 RepID=A0A5B7DDA3_PORTR|nr:hypothetical protein [Portunus trituberculatus]
MIIMLRHLELLAYQALGPGRAPPEGVYEERRRETFLVEVLQQVTSLGRGGHQLVSTCCHPLLHNLRDGAQAGNDVMLVEGVEAREVKQKVKN